MKAVRVHEHGGPEVLRVDEVSRPEPKPKEVLVKVRGAGINPYEGYMRQGTVATPERPFILGGEGAGEIEAVGAEVSDWQVGDAVLGSLKGSHAEYATANATQIFRKPEALSFHEAGGVSSVWITATLGLLTLGKLKAGETVVIHGATGGVGSAGAQIAKARGARVIATVGSAEKAEQAQAWADEVINYGAPGADLEAALKTAAPKGVDMVFDGVGGPVFVASMRNVRAEGRYVLYGYSGGATIEFQAPDFYRRNVTLIGFGGAAPRQGEARETFRDEVLPLFEAGKVKAVVDSVFPLTEVVAAYKRLHSRQAKGKIVLDPTA